MEAKFLTEFFKNMIFLMQIYLQVPVGLKNPRSPKLRLSSFTNQPALGIAFVCVASGEEDIFKFYSKR